MNNKGKWVVSPPKLDMIIFSKNRHNHKTTIKEREKSIGWIGAEWVENKRIVSIYFFPSKNTNILVGFG